MVINEARADSWFKLSQILITLAGLLFVSSAFITNSQGVIYNTIPQIKSICSAYPVENGSCVIENMTYNSCIKEYSKPLEDNLYNSIHFAQWGFTLAIISIIFAVIGFIKIRREDFKDLITGILLAILILIISLSTMSSKPV